MLQSLATSPTTVYEAVLALSRSMAGRNDIEGLLSGVSESLQKIVSFDYLGVALYDRKSNRMQGRILPASASEGTSFALHPDQDPAGWVWQNQRPLVIRSFADDNRWPEFRDHARSAGVTAITLVPLTVGQNHLGAFGFGCRVPFEPDPIELAFLERVASEFAVGVESFLARQEAIRERDRLQTLFDITNALVSKLSRDKLFAAIAAQLSRLIRHDFCVLTLRNNDGSLEMVGLQFTGARLFEKLDGQIDPQGSPAAEALATGKSVIARAGDLERYSSPIFRGGVDMGCKSICCVPLITGNGTLGTLELVRTTTEVWTDDDVDFLMQVARQIAIAIENALSYQQLHEMKERLATEKLYLEDEIRFDHNAGNMVGHGAAFRSILKSVHIVAPTDSTVLILGETGTGKELVARAIHELSNRRKGSFVKVNCAAIPASLLESELFGHEKGSFTGAVAQKIGRFELAHHGTLFLDEIGEMPLELQPKLLRAIQDQEFERVGGTRTIRTDVRFVAATNRDLKAMIAENTFRADLYYRLHVYPIIVPPLRDRREDIPLLIKYFVQKHADRMGRTIDTIPTSAMEALTRYAWPGNIRELQNVIERSVILTNGRTLVVAMPDLVEKAGPSALHTRNSSSAEAIERQQIMKALEQTKGIVGGPNGAAARLGLKRTTLQSRMRKYNVARLYQ